MKKRTRIFKSRLKDGTIATIKFTFNKRPKYYFVHNFRKRFREKSIEMTSKGFFDIVFKRGVK